MDRRLERLEQQPAPPPPPPPQPLKDLTSALVDLDQLRKGGESNHGPEPRELVSDYLETLKTGIEIGQKRDPLPAGEQGTDWIKLIETSGIILDRLLQRYGQVRRQNAAVRAAGARATAVVTDAEVLEPDNPEVPGMSHRWLTAVESLANAIAAGDDPREFAISLERILNVQEFGMLRIAGIERVLSEIAPVTLNYPVLKTPEARAFLEAMLVEIQHPSEAGEAETP